MIMLMAVQMREDNSRNTKEPTFWAASLFLCSLLFQFEQINLFYLLFCRVFTQNTVYSGKMVVNKSRVGKSAVLAFPLFLSLFPSFSAFLSSLFSLDRKRHV